MTGVWVVSAQRFGSLAFRNCRRCRFLSVKCRLEGPKVHTRLFRIRSTRHLRMLGMGLLALCGFSAGALAQSQAPAQAPTVRVEPTDADSGADESQLAKKLQNPIGDLYSFPFQSNTNFNVGPHKGTQEILNIQPVIPLHINEDLNIITRTIIPGIWNPSLLPTQTVPQGIGPTSFSAFLSPSKPTDGWLWGVGPVVQIPTISSPTLGSNVWGAGPAFVLVKMAGPIVAGALINNVFSLGGTTGPTGTRYATFTFNPFLNYNFKGSWFVGSRRSSRPKNMVAGSDGRSLLDCRGTADQVVRQAASQSVGGPLQQCSEASGRRRLAAPHSGPLGCSFRISFSAACLSRLDCGTGRLGVRLTPTTTAAAAACVLPS